jgi:hypothetical protein
MVQDHGGRQQHEKEHGGPSRELSSPALGGRCWFPAGQHSLLTTKDCTEILLGRSGANWPAWSCGTDSGGRVYL